MRAAIRVASIVQRFGRTTPPETQIPPEGRVVRKFVSVAGMRMAEAERLFEMTNSPNERDVSNPAVFARLPDGRTLSCDEFLALIEDLNRKAARLDDRLKNKELFHFRATVTAALKRAAARESRGVDDLVSGIIEGWLERKGYHYMIAEEKGAGSSVRLRKAK